MSEFRVLRQKRKHGVYERPHAYCRMCEAAYKKDWQNAHPEKRAKSAAQDRARHPERYAAQDKRNHEKHGHPEHARKARKRGVATEKIDKALVFLRDGGLCGICSTPVDPAQWDLDHVIPLSKGGSNLLSNVQVSHPTCNRVKHNKIEAGPVLASYERV